jgi:asparagine synthase (glutamine-hydrolysing)
MCGIAGFIASSPKSSKGDLEASLVRMCERIKHRGPDDAGTWVDEPEGIALGHRRLSILDLSPAGHQPMESACGRYVVVFNGEIYNFLRLRKELEGLGHKFRGRSDTEVMLAAFCEWGLEAGLKRFVGMFALALWDRRERTLHLARDRMGEKPLYYGWSGGTFLFGSELKALRAHPDWHAEIDRGALALFLRYQCVPAPYCIYQHFFKLIPGCFLSLTEAQLAARQIPELRTYWSLRSVAEAGIDHPFEGNEDKAIEQFTELLHESVGQQMIADVPLGAFLSGGIDSSVIVALMQLQSGHKVRTFSIGFNEETFNEAHHAKEVARHLGTQHTEFYVQPKDLHEVTYQMPTIYDEPFADSSQIPTTLLCKLTRQQVTVSLSGDGGDELFGGYNDYLKAARLWKCLRLVPEGLRERGATLLRRMAQTGLEAGLKPGRGTHLLNRAMNLAELLPVPSELALYRLLMSAAREPAAWLKDTPERPTQFSGPSSWQFLPEMLQRMMYLDAVSYLPDDILVKVDRAAMSASLETRIPLLDHRLVEFVWKLPLSFKINRGRGKWLLRQVLDKYVPRALVDRPKKGFSVPLAAWLRGPLREWSETLLSPARLRQQGFFRQEAIGLAWQEHLLQKRDWAALLWNVLMFQAWFESQS